jgi:hypothetical protein
VSLLLWLLWTAVALAVLKLLYGPRRWYSEITAHVRPGTPEPTASGFTTLRLRDAFVVVLLLAFAVPTTWERYSVSEDELREATSTAVDLVPEGSLTRARLEAQLQVLLDRDVRVDDLSEEYADPDDPSDLYWEVRVADPYDPFEDVEDRPYVCIDLSAPPDTGIPSSQSATVNTLGCRD